MRTASPSGLSGPLPAPPPHAHPCRIATAGWAIPAVVAEHFPRDGTGLERYAAKFDGVEINSTFYRRHRASTYARWAAATPPQFRFALKLPRAITHDARLVDAMSLVAAFRADVEPLRPKLGPLLVQLPPSLPFEPAIAEPFFTGLRRAWPEAVVCEPRHPTWFESPADALLCEHRVGRVAADPVRHPAAATPGGWPGIAYWRLHGSPRMYYSAYGEETLLALAATVSAAASRSDTWCVFDNTTSGAAAANALRLQALCAQVSDGPADQRASGPSDR